MKTLTTAERDELERETLRQLVRDLAGISPSKQTVLARLADAARRIVLAEGTCVLEIENEVFCVTAPSGSTEPFAGQRFAIMPPPSLFREVIATQNAVYTNDGETDPRVDPRFRAPLNVKHVAVAPILINGCVDGLLVCVNSARGGYTADDMASLQRLADHTALALFSARLVHQAEAAAHDARARAEEAAREGVHLSVLARTAHVLASALTRDELYNGLATVIAEDLGAAGCSVYEADAEKRTARVEFQAGVGVVDVEYASNTFWVTRLAGVMDTGEPLFIDDLARTSNQPELLLTQPLRREGIGAAAVLPVFLGDRPRGVLIVRYKGTRIFDSDERRLLGSFATQMALALRHVGYFANLELRAHRLTALAQAQQRLTRIVSREALLPAIAEAVVQVVPAPVCDLFFLGPDGLQRVFATRDGHSVSVETSSVLDLDLVRATYNSGVPRIGVSIAHDGDSARRLVELCAPLRFGERSVGVLRLATPDHGSFDLQDLDLVTILARHAGSAIETARLFGMQDLERLRAEAAADLARAALSADRFAEGANRLLQVLDRVVPTSGKAVGISRNRDGRIEYVAVSGSLGELLGHRPAGTEGVNGIAPDGRPFEVPNLRDMAPGSVRDYVPSEWGLAIPLVARERTLGVLLASMPNGTRLEGPARITLERLSASLALAFDALLHDEEERQARERERMLAAALTTMDQPVFILDLDTIRYANPAALREYGWSLAELSGMTFDELAVGGESASLLETQETAIGAPAGGLPDDHHRRRDGTEFPVTITQNAIAADDGTVVGHVISVRNMTTERNIAEQMRHAEKMVALGELVAGVAHEINNPLTGISAFAQLLLEEELNAEQRESVQLIKRESDRAKTVIRDLLLFARKEGAAAGPVDINELLEQTLRLRTYQLRNSGVEVTLLLDPSAPRVTGDSQKLQQVLLNIIVNAEHAMEGSEKMHLLLRTAVVDDQVVIEATDTGHGMSADVRRRIFEPFYTTKPAGIGTGLGLSVSYGIVQAHHGIIDVQSEPDAGTTISITLPAARPSGLFIEAAERDDQ